MASSLGKRELRGLLAVSELRRHRKAIALQQAASACQAREAALATRYERMRAMADDIAYFRREYVQRSLARGEGRELLSRGIDALLGQRALQMIEAVEDRRQLAEARKLMQEATRRLTVEDERLKLHRRALSERLGIEAEQQDEWETD